MDLNELLALMAATIFAADENRDGGYRGVAAERSVEQAEMIWRAVLDRKKH